MKRVAVFALAVLCASLSVAGDDKGVVSTADYIEFPVWGLDSAGIPGKPDSGHLWVRFEGEATANAWSFADSFTTAGAQSSYIDSLVIGGVTEYYFRATAGSIDNDEGNGLYTGCLTLFYKLLPERFSFTFTLAADEMSDFMADIQNIDGWNPITDNDSLIVDQSTLEDMAVASVTGDVNIADADMGTIGDSTVEVLFDRAKGDTATNTYMAEVAKGTDVASFATASEVGTEVWRGQDTANVDSSDIGVWLVNNLAGSGVWSTAQRDSVLNTIEDANKGNYKADVSALALQTEVANLNGWAPITDNDSLIVDQSSLEDMGVATVTSVTNQVTADVTAISGDATAADNLEAMLDETGGVDLTVDSLKFTVAFGNKLAISGTDTAVVIKGTNSYPGFVVRGGTNQDAVHLYSPNDNALHIESDDAVTYKPALWVDGAGTVDMTGNITGNIFGFVTPTDTATTGDTIAVMPQHWTAADSAGFQGSATGLTAAEIIDSLLNLVPGDSITNTIMSMLVYASDPSNWADITPVLDSLYAVLDSIQNHDDWVAKEASLPTAADSGGNRYVYIDLDGTHGNLKSGTYESNALDNVFNNDTSFTQVQAAVNEALDSIKNHDDWAAMMPDFWTAADSAGFQGSGGGSDTVAIKAAAANNPGLFYGPSATGSGSDSVVIYAIDTSGADAAVNDVKLTILDATGAEVAAATTEGVGSRTFWLDPGSYTVAGRRTRWLWPSAALVVSGHDDSVAFEGYDIPLDSDTPDNTCNVQVIVTDQHNNPIRGATVTFTFPEKANNSCDSTVLLQRTVTDRTNSDGLCAQDLVWSSCLGNKEYSVVVSHPAYGSKQTTFLVPDEVSYTLIW